MPYSPLFAWHSLLFAPHSLLFAPFALQGTGREESIGRREGEGMARDEQGTRCAEVFVGSKAPSGREGDGGMRLARLVRDAQRSTGRLPGLY